MRLDLTAGEVDTLDDADDPALVEATDLLASSVPQACRGLVAYHAGGYWSYLAAALTPPVDARTVILRAVRGPHGLRAVADWRLLPGQLLLNGIAVRDDDRGRGLGSRLLGDGHDLAVRLGCRALLLDVSLDNPAAHRLYLRHGFTDLTRSSWREVLGVEASTPASIRLVNWPAFAAHHTAYGFGDLTVRTVIGDDVDLRVVGTAIRVPAAPDAAALAAAASRLVEIDRCFSATTGTDERPAAAGTELARFVRMRCTLAATPG
ncbi:GNAT family N-acetyltransferase [Micromonospora sp. WMMD710]|uniref:GNAT family N-acetyltransferase n=1 Tax=Micromonospora sp. WMMD710 TaxID=3016085 RepID=UPI0024167BA3|nr:GNAT family N-acetyltransferase [Micromonospora sp. WMMD710]MDG4758915.1 GNAT family N-acetyltransferase [Micromonospora sp. WMMD710]